MAIGDIYRLALIGRVSTTQVVNVHHFKVLNQTGVPGVEATALAQAFADAQETLWESCNHQGVVMDLISVRGVTHPGFGADLPIAWQGALTGNLLPFQTTPEVIWRTAKFGRRYRGRTFLPPTTEERVANGVIDAPTLALLDAYANGMITVSQTADPTWSFRLVVYSAANATGEEVTTEQVFPTLRTQRRRTPGFGA